MHELELKFQVPASLRPSLEQELRCHGGRRTRLLARYFDTPDGLLGRQLLSLRLRREGRRWVQTLKAAGRNAVHRLEHEVVLRVAAGSEPALDIARHDGTPAGERLRQVLADAGAPPVVERFTTDIHRLAARLPAGDGIVEAALDVGAIRAGDRALPVCEVELEHVEGDRAAIFELARGWRAHGGLWLDTRSKAQRGGIQADGREFGLPVKARLPVLTSDMSGHALTRAAVSATLDQVLGNVSEIGAGSADVAEHVHQLRVGLRRLRTALRELGPLTDGIDPAWEPRLAESFGQLGAIRDDETVAAAVRPLLEQAGAPRLAWQPASAGADAAAIVRDAHFQDTLLSLLRWSLEDETAGPVQRTADDTRAHVRQRLSSLHRQVSKAGRRFLSLPTEDQHRTRKRLKRLRYLKQLTPAQDALGHHNDVVVATDRFRSDAEQDPRSFFAAGYLLAHQAQTALQAHEALAEVDGARKFWKS